MNIHVVMLTRAHFDNDTKLVEWDAFRDALRVNPGD